MEVLMRLKFLISIFINEVFRLFFFFFKPTNPASFLHPYIRGKLYRGIIKFKEARYPFLIVSFAMSKTLNPEICGSGRWLLRMYITK